MAREGFSARLKPILGYSSGITASIWTGTYPSTHGYWLYWGRNENVNTNRIPSIFSLFNVFPKGKLRVLAKHVFWYLLIQAGSSAQAWFMPSLPNDLLPYVTKYGSDFHPETFTSPVPTLFDVLRKNGVRYRWRETRSLKASKFHPIAHAEDHICFEVLSIPNLDSIGHNFGPLSPEIDKEMSRLDSFVEQVIEEYSSIVKDLHVLMFSDHGMAEITKRVDVKGQVDKLPLKPIRDYIGFYDSTIARFWVFNEEAEEILQTALRKIPEGRVLESEELKREGMFFEDNRYGDIIFQMNLGVEIFPNYFVSILPSWMRRSKGMHGYNGSNASQHGLFIYHGYLQKQFKSADIISVVDLLPTILDILRLPIPVQCEGVSLLKKRTSKGH
jgi:hypothetical protein